MDPEAGRGWLQRDVLDSLLDPVVVLEAVRDDVGRIVDFVYVDANQAACSENRIPRDELIGQRLLHLLPGHSRDGLLLRYAAVVETGESLVLNDQLYVNELHANRPSYYDIRATRVSDALVLTWRDVTVRHRDAEDLRHSRQRFRALAEQASDVVYFTDLDGHVQWVSPAIEAVLGWRPDQVIGRHMEELLDENDAQAVPSSADVIRLARAGRPQGHRRDVRVRTAQGDYRWVRADLRPLVDTQQEIVGAVGGWRDVDDLVRAQAKHESGLHRLRSTMDALVDPLAFLEPIRDDAGVVTDFLIAEMNEAACAFMGAERAQIVGTSLRGMYPDIWDLAGMQALVEAVTEGRPLRATEVPFGTADDGGPRYLDVRGAPAPGGVMMTIRDVTERQRVAEVLRGSERRFRVLAESVTDVVLEVDDEGRIVWASPSVSVTLGRSVSDVVGSALTDLVPEPPEDELDEAGYRSGEHVRIAHAKDGSAVWVAVRSVPVLDDQGVSVGSVVGMSDVTSIVQARGQADSARAEVRRAQLSMAEAAISMLQTGLDGRIRYANERAVSLTGRSTDTLHGLVLADLAPEEYQGELDRLIARVRSRVSHQEDLRWPLSRADGQVVWVDCYLSPIHEPDGSIGGILVQLVDVTEEVVGHEALTSSREHFRVLAEHATDVVFEADNDGIIQWVTPGVGETLGWTPEDLLGRVAIDLIHPDDREAVLESRRSLYRSGRRALVETRVRTVQGSYRWMAARADPILDRDHRVVGAVVGLRDVTDEREARRRLEGSERTFRTAMREAPQGMALSDLRDVMTEANPALGRILRQPHLDLIGHQLAEFVVSEPQRNETCAESLLRSGNSQVGAHEHALLVEEGPDRWIQHSVSLIREADGTPMYFVHQVVDVTSTKEREARLSYRASHDLLTGLPNREGLMARLTDWLPIDGEAGGLAVLFCDLDGLKQVNDDFGHAAGDAVIIEVARRLNANVRRGDIAARISGDEFVVVLDRIQSLAAAESIAEKVREGVRGPVEFEDTRIPMTVSVGVACAEVGESATRLLRRADEALYRAKSAGRDRVSL